MSFIGNIELNLKVFFVSMTKPNKNKKAKKSLLVFVSFSSNLVFLIILSRVFTKILFSYK